MSQQPPAVTSPGPAKAKRNSALIEKLQVSPGGSSWIVLLSAGVEADLQPAD